MNERPDWSQVSQLSDADLLLAFLAISAAIREERNRYQLALERIVDMHGFENAANMRAVARDALEHTERAK